MDMLDRTISVPSVSMWFRSVTTLYGQFLDRSVLVLITTLSSVIHKLDITDETALQLLQLTDEGLHLQIFDLSMGGCNFLKRFRERMCEQGISYFHSSVLGIL